jgi:hypothetical protein
MKGCSLPDFQPFLSVDLKSADHWLHSDKASADLSIQRFSVASTTNSGFRYSFVADCQSSTSGYS